MSTTESHHTITASQKLQIKAWWKKVKISNPHFQELKMSAVERGVFGIPLLESFQYGHTRISYIDDKTGVTCNGYIPIIIAKCGAFLKDQALSTEGIFRLSGNAKRISMLQTIFDTPNEYGLQLDWCGYTVHDASNVMRRFLNFLPEPVITLKYQSDFTNALDTNSTIESKVNTFQNLIEKLPILHQYLLFYLLDMLCLFSLHSKNTRMDLSSLATAFVPSILSDPNDAMNPSRYKEAQKVLEFLIEHQTKFSMPRPLNLNDDSFNSRLQQDLRRHNSMDIKIKHTITRPHSQEVGASHSVSNLEASHSSRSLPINTSLKRSKTAPSKREHAASEQGITENNNSSVSLNSQFRNIGRWKSIKRIVKEEDQQQQIIPE